MTEPVIDQEVFNEMKELMEDAMGEFIETYLDNSPKLLESISQSLPSEDLDHIFHNAHQLKGGSGSIGAMQVFQIAMQMEEKARGGEKDGLEDLFIDLQKAYEQAASELRSHL